MRTTSYFKKKPLKRVVARLISLKVFILSGTFFLLSTTLLLAINISKPSRICPGQAGTFTVTDLPSGTYRYVITITDVYDPSYLPQSTQVNRYIWESNSYTHTFNIVSGNANISVTAFTVASIQIGFESQYINKNLPAPAPPNNGAVIGCSPNQTVAISSLPALQNNSTDCYFHCNYNWTAPSGFTLSHTGASGNPLQNAESIVFPSSPSNGNIGQLTISALYSSCSYTINSSSSATIWYGPPIISYPNSWLFDSGSNMWQLSHLASPGSTSTYSVWSGSATLIPNGNDCYVTTTDGAVIELVSTNSCGNSTPYQFIIPQSSSMIVAYPNPAKDKITLQFKNTESSESLPEQILMYSEKSSFVLKTIQIQDVFEKKSFLEGNKIEINVADLSSGVYFLHVIPNKKAGQQKIEKIPILIE